MATSGSLTTTKYDGRYYKLAWERTSYSIVNNTSTIKWTLSAVGGNSSWYAERTLKAVIAGVTVFSKTTRKERYAGVIDSGTITLKHNSDGTKSFSASVQAAVYGSSVNCTGSNTFTLNTIDRKAIISSASNFTDMGNPKITYSNPAGTSATLAACIADSNGNIIVDYKTNVDETATSYTFSLTDADRTKLRNHIKTGNSATVRLYLRTTIGGVVIWRSYKSVTLSLVDYTPTLSPTISNYQQTRDLVGDETTLIRYYSTAKITIGAAARKGATIKSKKVTNSGKSRTTDGDITSVTSKTFTFTATDSRGYTTTVNKDADWVPYIKPTCNLKVNIGVDGVADITASGNFFNGSFGAVTNTLTVQFRYKEANGTYTSWNTMSLNPNGNTYTATQELTGLDYSKTYVFQAKASDKINEFAVTTPEKKVKSMPVFDWGEEDFHFHVPISAPNFGLTSYSATDCMIDRGKITTAESYVGRFYVLKPFNLVYVRLYVPGLTEAVSASTTAFTLCQFHEKLTPAANIALSCYGSADVKALLKTNGEIKVIPHNAIASTTDLYFSGVFPLNANSELYI